MSGSERWKQKWIAAIFLCGWLLFSFCESAFCANVATLTTSHPASDVHRRYQRGELDVVSGIPI